MRINRLRAVNFRRFRDLDISFTEGINLVRGPNESGKSTLVMAVMAGLFARPQTTTALGRSYMRWGTEDAPVIELDFSQNGRSYHLVKDFAGRTVSLEEDGGAPLRSIKAVNAMVSELIGFSDPARYLRTACVTHDQMVSLAEDASGARKLAGMLREVVVGGRESTNMEQAVRKLSATVDELKRGLERPTGNPGTIRRLLDERETLIARQRELTQGMTDVESQRARLKEVEGQLAGKEARLEELDDLLSRNMNADDLERRTRLAHARFESSDRVLEARRELQRTETKISKGFAEFNELSPDVENDVKSAMELRRSLLALREELTARPPESQRGASRPARGRPAAWWIAMGAGALIMIAGIILGVIQPVLFSIIAVGLAVMIAAVFSLRRAAPAPEVDIPGLFDDRIKRTDAQIARLETDEREFLRSVGCDDSEEFLSAFRVYRELLDERDEQSAGYRALLGGRTIEDIEEDRRQASIEAAACEEKLNGLKPFLIEPERLGVLTRERDGLAQTVAELRKERDGLAFHLVHSGTDPEEAARIEEEVSWLWEAEQAARRRLRVYTMARDAMQETARSLLSSAVPVLSESVGRTFSALSGGRYDTVEVSESDLALSVYSRDRGDFIPADELLASLSKGTASQLYLAARLELVELLSEGRKPPLIFDDSFSYFDDERLELLWDVLVDVSRDQQVIVLTCTDRYDRFAASGVNVVDLGSA